MCTCLWVENVGALGKQEGVELQHLPAHGSQDKRSRSFGAVQKWQSLKLSLLLLSGCLSCVSYCLPWDWTCRTTFLLLVSFVQSASVPSPEETSSQWLWGKKGGRDGSRQDTGVLLLLKPYNHQETCCNYPEHCGSWDACKCLSAMLYTVLD